MCCNVPDHQEDTCDTLLIGYGNALRGDDGAGPAVVDHLRQSPGPDLGTRVVYRTELQLTPELASVIAQARRVIFVDASVALPPGRVRLRRITAGSAAVCPGHHFSPPQLLELAQMAFEASPEAWVAAIGVQSLALGQGLSPPVAMAARRLASHLRYHLGQTNRKRRN